MPERCKEINKEALVEILTEELPALRAKIGITQEELCAIVGISRQTYSSIETRKRKMSWNTYLSLYIDKSNCFLAYKAQRPVAEHVILRRAFCHCNRLR